MPGDRNGILNVDV